MDVLDRESLIRFFEWHGVGPDKPRPNFVQYCQIMIDAHSVSHSFGCFARESFVGTTELRLVFESWDELWSCYKSYMAGYIGSR